jgi:hypothetical protein
MRNLLLLRLAIRRQALPAIDEERDGEKAAAPQALELEVLRSVALRLGSFRDSHNMGRGRGVR